MDEIRLNLHQDLEVKLDRLRWMSEQPGLFIDERFASLRKEIDLDTERLIHKLGNDNSNETKLQTINSTRSCFIRFLDKMQQKLFENLPKITDKYNPSWAEFEKQVEEFSASKEFLNVSQLEDAYLQLALEIIDASNELERRLLDDQTFAFVPAHKKDQMGDLVYLGMDCLNRDELSCLKLDFNDPYSEIQPECIHAAIQASLNRSLAVGVCRPFIITRNILAIIGIVDHFTVNERLPGKIVYHIGSSKSKLDLSSEDDSSFYHGFRMEGTEGMLFKAGLNSLEAVQLNQVPCGYIDCDRFVLCSSGNKLTKFEIADSCVQLIDQLSLSGQLEELDVQQLAKATQMTSLNLMGPFFSHARFSLHFMSSLTELFQLELTLPNVLSVDFRVFENLKKLENLHLESAASLDCSNQRPQLTKKHFDALSTLPRLTNLYLSYFEIGSLKRDSLRGLSGLRCLYLSNNNIVHIEPGVFGKCFRGIWRDDFDHTEIHGCRSLHLNYNRIEKLSPGVFDDLVAITNLHLAHNSIRHIARGVFNKLIRLRTLNLSYNLIESIKSESFKGCLQLTRLHLNNCKLKLIGKLIFKGMKMLSIIHLEHNPIKKLGKFSLKSERSWIKKILLPRTRELLNRKIFVDFLFLSELNLKGNKLEKLDLNWFSDLTYLLRLDASSNQIRELNAQIGPGVLWFLDLLDLSENQLTCVKRRAFGESKNLQTLRLARNKLKRLDDDFFSDLRLLSTIELQENNLNIHITKMTFAACERLQTINVLDNPSVSVEEDAFSMLKQLQKVHLEVRKADQQSSKRFLENAINSASISQIYSLSLVNSSIENMHAFKIGHRFSELTRLDLSKNLIRNIHRESISSLTLLKMFNLSGNLIETLDDPAVFKDMSQLQELNLSGNKLKSIHRQVFRCLIDLESLDMSRNPELVNIDAGMFRGLFNLKRLYLAGNNIASFYLACLFRSCRLLEYLDLSDNQIDDFESFNETCMSRVSELNLANSRLYLQLQKVNVSGNKIDAATSNFACFFGQLINFEHQKDLNNDRIKSLDVKTIFSNFRTGLEIRDSPSSPFNKALECTRNCYAIIENS